MAQNYRKKWLIVAQVVIRLISTAKRVYHSSPLGNVCLASFDDAKPVKSNQPESVCS